MSHGSAAAIPTPTLERASKAFRCLPTSRLLAADLAGSGLGASTNATELAAKTVPAMGEVIAFPTRLYCGLGHMHTCMHMSHAHVHVHVGAPQHSTEWTWARARVQFFAAAGRI